ncbi:MAG: RepB family DNA primase [Acidobacteria bacterium]|nr:RepB family DNA primase [Acidobacteriota bacterium]MCI0721672.1 RepB family DNA primase [Acidobacteriota bacterium]
MQTLTSWEYVKDAFQPRDRLAVVVRHQESNSIQQRVTRAEVIAGPDFQRWLRFENAHGADVYVGMNPLTPGATRRTKESILEIRHVYLDLDENGARNLKEILNDGQVPRPSYVLNTSPGKHQVVWKVDNFSIAAAELLQRAMAIRFGADRAATDVARVLRIPGFFNKKYRPPVRVTAERLSEQRYTPPDFQMELDLVKEATTTRSAVSKVPRAGKLSQSELDWADTMERLKRGESPSAIQLALEQKRQDKREPGLYAEVTVRKAVAELNRRRGEISLEPFN